MLDDLDDIDYKILNRLQDDCSQSIAEIADQTGLSKSACHRRIKRLNDAGYIVKFSAIIDPKKVGYSLTFSVEISLHAQSSQSMESFEYQMLQIPEVQVCQLVTGESDYLLQVIAKSMEDYERIHHKLARLPGVFKIKSASVLRSIKTGGRITLGA